MGGSVGGLRVRVSRWARPTGLALGLLILSGCTGSFVDLWLTADQQGRLAWDKGRYEEAAKHFEDPIWRGTAMYMSGDFESAIEEFAVVDTAEAWFARGNARAHQKEYEKAIPAYEKALELREDWTEAQENLEYVKLFIPYSPEGGGGDMGAVGDVARPDEIKYDADSDRLKEEGKDTTLEGSVLTDEQIADMWLQQVETSPSAFLRYKFAYQYQIKGEEPE